MNFIKDKELALRFKNNEVPSKERFLYLLAHVTLTTLLSSSLFDYLVPPSVTPNQWSLVIDFVVVVFTIFGTILCYQTNKKGDDKDFVERYICISFPAMIQSLLIFIGVWIIYAIALSFSLGVGISEEYSIYDIPPFILMFVYYFWRLNASMSIASHP